MFLLHEAVAFYRLLNRVHKIQIVEGRNVTVTGRENHWYLDVGPSQFALEIQPA